jgi:flagellar basal-body rod modification protein FlgD
VTIDAITQSTGPVLGAPERDYSEINNIDFMNLLVAQIKNQDPLSPMDNQEFTSQITQFTMLEELQTLGQKLDDNLVIGQSINNTAMLGLVGRKVTVEGDQVWLDADGASASHIDVTQTAHATIEVLDEDGQVVDTYERALVAGRNDVTWEPSEDLAAELAGGTFSLRIEVERDGAEVPFVALMTGPVTGLRYENNLAIVEVGGEEFYVSEIYKVS